MAYRTYRSRKLLILLLVVFIVIFIVAFRPAVFTEAIDAVGDFFKWVINGISNFFRNL